MSEEKIRVKDITTELGVSNKDMLAALRELNISAKSHMATLTAEDVERVRKRFSSPTTDEDKVRRETQTGVIVRRRRREADTPAEGANVEPLAAKEPEGETPPAAPPSQPEPPAAPEGAPEAPVAAKPEKAPRPRREPEPKARIIRRADEPTPPKTMEPAPAPASANPEADPAAPSAKLPAPSAPVEKNPAKPRLSKANISAEPERGADGSAVSSAPVLAPRSERADEDPAGPARDRSRSADAGKAPVSQVRVISRPASGPRPPRATTAEGDARSGPSRPGDSRPGGRPGGGPRPGGPRPGGSGSGEQGRPFGVRAPASPPFDPAADAAGKKKRQKGRRTVEFEFGSEEYGKRHKEMDAGDDGAWARGKGKKRGKGRDAGRQLTVTQPIKAAKRKIRVDEFIRVSDLAHQMGLKVTEIIKVLFNLGVMATINQTLDVDTATLVASEFEYEVEKVGFSEEVFLEEQAADSPESLKPRPPVVTIMGHVDHGKTSLLDAIRKSSVVSGEAGGITQHIGAYYVKTKKGQIVFLDTPGHEAFTAMRARGAEITDIVVLVVAADDGVMEQTREAISHAKAAGVPIMVAVNKMDKEEANPDRVKRELADQGLVPEDWGGETTFSYVSAKSRTGVDELLDLIALQAEILELKANPDKPARGHIIEAKLDKGRGSLGTVLIQQGTLNLGDAFVCGVHFGRVRAMFDDQGKKVKTAGPSMPVEVQGFEGVPEAGEEFICITDEKAARRIAETRTVKHREKALAKESRVTLETFLSRKPEDVEALVLNLVVKADVQGSIEAIVDALNKLSTEKVRLHVIHTGAGAISESDVLLASASDAIIIGFNVRPTPKSKELIEQEKIDTRFYDIIYKLVEEVKSAMEGMLAPVEKEVYLGLAEVREIFSVPKVGVIAGCHVADGKITRNANIRLLRDSVVIYTGKISSLKRFKDDAREVLKGYECGIGLERFNDLKIGDAVEAFELVEEAASL
ncbi:MAG: translation initiation factor IF-2 [Deltaproteobacteria bacterium]|jgi:translation initiation factor IF-2|nr:translation initiation factor IF-2 [Deltaproteobacteria bacterium]